jgi:hypothetical protein
LVNKLGKGGDHCGEGGGSSVSSNLTRWQKESNESFNRAAPSFFRYEDSYFAGVRLYRESSTRSGPKRGTGAMAPEPEAGKWETVCAEVDDFKRVAERFAGSQNRKEQRLGKFIRDELLAELEEKERVSILDLALIPVCSSACLEGRRDRSLGHVGCLGGTFSRATWNSCYVGSIVCS